MKVVALLVLAASVSACSTTSQTTAKPIIDAIAQEIPHCDISGSFNAGAGGVAGTGTGVAFANQFHCPGQPYPAPGGVNPTTSH